MPFGFCHRIVRDVGVVFFSITSIASIARLFVAIGPRSDFDMTFLP